MTIWFDNDKEISIDRIKQAYALYERLLESVKCAIESVERFKMPSPWTSVTFPPGMEDFLGRSGELRPDTHGGMGYPPDCVPHEEVRFEQDWKTLVEEFLPGIKGQPIADESLKLDKQFERIREYKSRELNEKFTVLRFILLNSRVIFLYARLERLAQKVHWHGTS